MRLWRKKAQGDDPETNPATRSDSASLSSATTLVTPAPVEYDANQLGLTVLVDQDDDNPDAIDIVALHGLNGHYLKTWQATSSSGQTVLWFRDFLPRQIPQARVMSFGYESTLLLSKSVADVGTFAEQLLESLLSQRVGEARKRPLLLICHSLGGIVAKKAIIKAHERDERYGPLLDCIRGIMFFGTPHRGSSLAGWATLFANLARSASFGVVVNSKLSKDLERQSQTLLDISKSFVDRGKDLQFISFYETDRMDFLNCRVVEEESAILGVPNEVAIAMKGNHRSMCRFETITGPRYRLVWTNLQNLAGSLAKQRFKPSLESAEENANRRKHFRITIQDSLVEQNCYLALHNSNYKAHRDRNPPAVPGTCQWLLQHEKYCKWRGSLASDLLWLSADPGCGKSVLISYIVDHLTNKDNKVAVPEAVCYFFFKNDNDEQQTGQRAISATLHQLYAHLPWLIRHAIPHFKEKGDAMLRDFGTLWDILLASVTDDTSRDVILILDGLDECEPVTRQQLLKSLAAFYGDGRNSTTLGEPPFVKTIVASRPDNDIKAAFDILPTIRLRGEDEPEAISRDVELVVRHHIEKASLRGLPRSVLKDFETGLIKGADRTFLWTTLAIELLKAKKGASKRELNEILQSHDIYRIYRSLLESIEDQAKARKLLQIVVAAARPMSLTELSIALSVNSAQLSLVDLEMDVIHNPEERVKDLCGNFVRIIRETVYLVHQTAREFLLQKEDTPAQHTGDTTSTSTGDWQDSIVLRDAHSRVLDICLEFLCFLNARTSQPLLNFFEEASYSTQFLDYAASFWTRHYAEVAPHLSEGQMSMCVQLCHHEALGFKYWFPIATAMTGKRVAYEVGYEVAIFRPKRIARHLGLYEVVKRMEELHDESELEWKDESRLSPASADSHAIPTSPSRNSNPIIQPHAVTPSAWNSSPLSAAMLSGSSSLQVPSQSPTARQPHRVARREKK